MSTEYAYVSAVSVAAAAVVILIAIDGVPPCAKFVALNAP